MKPNIFLYNDLWKEKYIHPDLLSKQYSLFVDEIHTSGIGRDIYWFPAFNDTFCDDILEIANTQNHWGKEGHVQYRTHDTWLTAIGMNKPYNEFIKEFIVPLGQYVFGDVIDDLKKLDDVENFIAKYEPNRKHSILKIHVDDSDYSIQVSLNHTNEYVGGGTWYPKQKNLIKVPKGYAVMHPGSVGFSHGARRVMSGVRYQLVSFIKGE